MGEAGLSNPGLGRQLSEGVYQAPRCDSSLLPPVTVCAASGMLPMR